MILYYSKLKSIIYYIFISNECKKNTRFLYDYLHCTIHKSIRNNYLFKSYLLNKYSMDDIIIHFIK